MAVRAEDIGFCEGAVDIDRDRVLVLRHQGGDVDAFDELYRRYHSRLLNYCLRRVGDRHVAEELAQEAFLKALRAMPHFAGERRFYPWMTVIAQRLCIDHHRRAKRVEPAADIDTGSVEADHDAVFAAVDRDLVTRAIARLAPRHREILELREEHGWSYQQIAEHLSVPMTTVEALLHRARKALRREFAAVSGHDPLERLAAMLPGAGLGGLLAKARGWLSSLTPERLVPLVGTAAAGVAAIGLAAGPLTAGADHAVVNVRPPAAVATATAGPTATGTVGSIAGAGLAPTGASGSTAGAPLGPTSPRGTVDLGVVEIYPGAAGSEHAEAQGEQMPRNDEVGPVGYAADPGAAVADVNALVNVLLGGEP